MDQKKAIPPDFSVVAFLGLFFPIVSSIRASAPLTTLSSW
jgi:hypothetical protein